MICGEWLFIAGLLARRMGPGATRDPPAGDGTLDRPRLLSQ
jgi:hypothetical protein